MSQTPENDQTKHLKEENKMLKDKLERANQQIKLLAAVLQIVHEDLSMKNEQLEILYSNLQQNPVWQDCMLTVNQNDNDNNDIKTDNNINTNINNNNDTSNNMILIARKHDSNNKINTFTISNEILRTINPSTKCYLNDMAEHTQIALCSFIPYNDLAHLAQTNKLWHNIISDDLVWRICFRVKWPMDELTYSSESSCDEFGKLKKNEYNEEIAFSKFHKSLLHKRNKKKKKKKKKKRKKKQLNNQLSPPNDNNNDYNDPSLSPSPVLSAMKSPPQSQSINHIPITKPSWKRQFMDRIHIERNWRQGTAQVMTLMGHNGSVTDLKFDEYRLVTSSDDGSIILWHLNNMKKWRPKHKLNSKDKRYKFFPTKEEKKNDDNDQEDEEEEEDKDNDEYSDDSEMSSSVSDCNNINNINNNNRNNNNRNALPPLPSNSILYHMNDDWNLNDTKLSAWRHSFVNKFSIGSYLKKKTSFSKKTSTNKLKMKQPTFDHTNMLLQNHHYSKDLNFKRLAFQGHGGPIWALDFDDEILVSGSYDKCIKIWNIANGNCRATLRGHSEWVSGIKLYNKYILSCSWDASIRLWKLDNNRFNGQCISKLETQSGNAIYCIEWSKDKNFIISGCRHKAIQIWDLKKEKMIKTFMGHTKQVYCLQMNKNLILSGSADRTIKMWDPRTASCLGTFNNHMGPVMKLQFDDHKLISAGYDKQVRIFDLRCCKQLHSLSAHSKVIFSLQYDNKKIITGSADKRVLVWNFD